MMNNNQQKEIDVYIQDLFDVAHSVLFNPWVYEKDDLVCRFCGTSHPDHSDACPSVRFLSIREKAWKEKQALEEAVESSLGCIFHGRKPTREEFARAVNAFRELEIAQTPPGGSA
jgi:hypothetical protein